MAVEKPPKRLERLNLETLSFTLPSGVVAFGFSSGPLGRSEGVEKQKKGCCCAVTLTCDSSNIFNVIIYDFLKPLSTIGKRARIVSPVFESFNEGVG